MENDSPEVVDEFTAFLDSSAAEEELKARIELNSNEHEVRFREMLRSLGYESLSAEDTARESWMEYLIENPADSEATKRAKIEELDIRTVLMVWGMMDLGLDSIKDEGERQSSQRTLKVGIYALLIENGDYDADSPILQATSLLLPGKAVHLQDEDVIAAVDALHKANEENPYDELDIMVSEAYSATDIGVYEDSETADKMSDAVFKIVNIIYLKSLVREPGDVSWHAQREAVVREKALKYGIPNRYTDQLVAYFKSRDEMIS